MSGEARVQSSLSINPVGNAAPLQYQSRPTSFNLDMSVGRGPSPGTVQATTQGVLISFSLLVSPGPCRLMNLYPTNDGTRWAEVGLYIPSLNEFFPLLEVYPGQTYVVYLSQYLGQEFGTSTGGTGTGGVHSQLMIRGIGGAQDFLIEAFDR